MPVHANVAQRIGGKQIHPGLLAASSGKHIGGKSVARPGGKQISGKYIASKQSKRVNPLLASKRVHVGGKQNPKAQGHGPGSLGTTRRKKPGTAALIEIKELQGITKGGKYATTLLIRKGPFAALLKELRDAVPGVESWAPDGLKMASDAKIALQEAAENYLTGLFADGLLETIHGRRVTLQVKDLQIARRVRGEVA